MATSYSVDNGRRALPHLVACATKRTTLTYHALGEKIGCHSRAVHHLLGYIRDDICAPARLPWLNAIAVRQATGLPGERFLPTGTDHLTAEEYRAVAARHQQEVFDFSGWDEVLRDLGLRPL
jgi:hypothetical protein